MYKVVSTGQHDGHLSLHCLIYALDSETI